MTEHTRSAIDLVFVNNSHRIFSYGAQQFAASDHSLFLLSRKQEFARLQQKFAKLEHSSVIIKNNSARMWLTFPGVQSSLSMILMTPLQPGIVSLLMLQIGRPHKEYENKGCTQALDNYKRSERANGRKRLCV